MRYEVEVVHAATEHWLIAHNLEYQHELTTKAGRADFAAWKGSVRQGLLIIECKVKWRDLPDGVDQVQEYCQSLRYDGFATWPMIVMPYNEAMPISHKYDKMLAALEIPLVLVKVKSIAEYRTSLIS